MPAASGGISSGQDIVASIALKATSSLRLPGKSIDLHGEAVEVITEAGTILRGHSRHTDRRSDAGHRLLDHLLRHRAQNCDVDAGLPILR